MNPPGHPDDASWLRRVSGAVEFKNLPTGAGDSLKLEASYAKGAAKYVFAGTVDTLGGGRFAKFDGNTVGFGRCLDGVYAPGGQIVQSSAWEVSGFFEHYWNPAWRTSLFANYSHISRRRGQCLLAGRIRLDHAGLRHQFVLGSGFVRRRSVRDQQQLDFLLHHAGRHQNSLDARSKSDALGGIHLQPHGSEPGWHPTPATSWASRRAHPTRARKDRTSTTARFRSCDRSEPGSTTGGGVENKSPRQNVPGTVHASA